MIHSTLFIFFFLAASILFVWSCRNKFSLVKLGTSEQRFDSIPQRIKSALTYSIAQKRVVGGSPFGINHAVMFWSFLILLVLNLEFIVNGIVPALSFAHLPASLLYPLKGLFDIVSLLVIIAVTFAALRKIFNPLYVESRSFEGFFILALIGGLMCAYFGLNGAEIALGTYQSSVMTPISTFISHLYNGMSHEQIEIAARLFWWSHAVILLGFMNFLPYSKHMHILTAIPNTFFKSLEKPLLPKREQFVKGETFGVGRVDKFSWKDIFDTYSCTECGRCQDICPGVNTEKPLNPRILIHDIKENLLQNRDSLKACQEPLTKLIADKSNGTIPVDAIWSCVTCGACMEVCPVFIEHVPKVVKLRRYLVEQEAQFPEELLNLFENLEQRSNPWGIAPSERSKWSAHSDVKPFEKDKTDYLLYVGCAGAFDSRSKQVTLALSMILDNAGVSWGIMGKEEQCCGDSARRLGNEYLFEQMALKNVEMFKEKGVKKIITQCPHCFTTLKNDYRQFGIELEVIHHSQLIDELLREKRLKLKESADELGKVSFHDSCYLGRHNSIYEAPRNIIQSVTGKTSLELKNHHDKSFCCGAGGGRMWLEENLGSRMNLHRVQQAVDNDSDTVCVSCPYCLTMFEDGIKDVGSDKLKVQDIAEIVAKSLA